MQLLALLPIIMGSGIASQTGINAQLGKEVRSPFLASMISFVIGAVFLTGLLVGQGTSPWVSQAIIANHPWWIWLGGLLGVIGLTTNILLFPKLGSIQTAVLPIFGQIIMGQLIDKFGLFKSPVVQFTFAKALGLLLLAGGVLLTMDFFHSSKQISTRRSWSVGLYRLLGFLAGMVMATQTAINGELGLVLGSSLHAAMISFTIGAVLLVVIVLVLPVPFANLKLATPDLKQNWWLWCGGFLGALYVLGSAWLVPQLGTGQVVVLALFGQLFFSAVIDHWGLLRSTATRVTLKRLLGLVVMFIGVVMLHFM